MGRQDHPSNPRYLPLQPPLGIRYFDTVDHVLLDSIPEEKPAPTFDPTDAGGWAEVLAGALEDILFTVDSVTTVGDAEEIWRRYCVWADGQTAPASPNWSGTESSTPTESGLVFDPEFDEAVLDRLADAITEYIIAVATALKSSTLK